MAELFVIGILEADKTDVSQFWPGNVPGVPSELNNAQVFQTHDEAYREAKMVQKYTIYNQVGIFSVQQTLSLTQAKPIATIKPPDPVLQQVKNSEEIEKKPTS